ncbi:MAG: ATP cone domain-containing protein [Promethearchaeota archaeon]
MVGIKKRDGRSENFVAEKIVVSAVKSGAPASVAREIAKKVEAEVKDGISTKDIKRMVLEMLREENPEWEKNWLIYDREVKKRIE